MMFILKYSDISFFFRGCSSFIIIYFLVFSINCIVVIFSGFSSFVVKRFYLFILGFFSSVRIIVFFFLFYGGVFKVLLIFFIFRRFF